MANIITIPEGAIVNDIDIYIDKQTNLPFVNARQYDSGMRYIRASIWNDGDLYPMVASDTICLTATKPDRNPLFNQAGIDSEGRILYEMTDQTTSAFGVFIAEFRIYNTKEVDGTTVNTLKSTYDFKINVAKSNVQDTEIVSTPEFNALTDAMASVGDLITDVTDAVERVNNALIDTGIAINNANTKANLANEKAILADEKATQANDAAVLANEKAGLADTATSNANAATTNANTATTNAITATSNANTATINAQNAADYANDVATILDNETLKIFKPAVSTYTDLSTTYPIPENGWTVTVTDEAVSYRYNGTEWINLGVISSVDTATDTTLGIVKGGGNINIGTDGTISVPSIGDINQLETVSTELVGAINEVNAKPSVSTAEDVTYGKSNVKVTLDNHSSQLAEIAINVKTFGAKGDGITDDRPHFESALNHLKTIGGGTLLIEGGRFLLNSYSSDSALASFWGQILPLYSNIKIVIAENAEVVVGDFFNNKKFMLFSSFNDVDSNFTNVDNVTFEGGGKISFSGTTSKMESVISKRVGIALGKFKNVVIQNITFADGDLRNGIIGGFETDNQYFTVRDCKFIDLVQDGVNNDFTAVYANAEFSHVVDCDFSNESRKGAEISACVELHQSNSYWKGGSVKGYARGSFLAATPSESVHTKNLEVTGIKGVVTTSLCNLWASAGCTLENVDIHNNQITSMTRDATMTDTLFYGVSTIITTSGANLTDGALSKNIKIHDNTFIVPDDTRSPDLSSVIAINSNAKHLSDVRVYNNDVSVKTLIYTKGCEDFDLSGLFINDNRYDVDKMSTSVFALFTLKSISNSHLEFSLNKELTATYLIRFIVTESGSNNTIIIHPENTGNITTPLEASEILRSVAKLEYPHNLSLVVGSSTGVFVAVATPPVNINRAKIIDRKALPENIYLMGDLFKSDNALRTLVSVYTATNGTYSIRALVSNLK